MQGNCADVDVVEVVRGVFLRNGQNDMQNYRRSVR